MTNQEADDHYGDAHIDMYGRVTRKGPEFAALAERACGPTGDATGLKPLYDELMAALTPKPDLGPLVKLGDVRQWLRAGDRFVAPAVDASTWTVTSVGERFDASSAVMAYQFTPGCKVRLISPRWERLKVGDVTRPGDVLCDECSPWLRKNEGDVPVYEGETIYRLVRTSLATRKAERTGDRYDVVAVDEAQGFGEQFAARKLAIAPSAPTGWHPNGVSVTSDPHAALREEFRFIADRVDWHAVATICELRGWADCKVFALKSYAQATFDTALAPKRGGYACMNAASGCGMLIDTRSGHVALYLEALNAAAYHAKCEELWPKRVEAERPARKCFSCEAKEHAGCRIVSTGSALLCGDCYGYTIAVLRDQGPGTEPTPPHAFPLSPSASYHLADDTGWSTPGWEA